MAAKAIAIFGTASDVGKSLIATAVCRIFAKANIDVVPFKAQNMSNNSSVTPQGGEIATAQAIQAIASYKLPEERMNPILLKPSADNLSQLVIMGRVAGTRDAKEYFSSTEKLSEIARKALTELLDEYQLVVIEGAGSCAEVNLMDKEFTNFKMAEKASAAVILVADIDRGGVFAQVIGTLACLPERYRKMVRGIIINKFRGDISLFEEGVRYIEEKTGIDVLGVVPFFYDIEIDPEDSLPREWVKQTNHQPEKDKINIGIVRLPRISNFTDFLPLAKEPDVRCIFVEKPVRMESLDALILPGSKNTIGDTEWMKKTGWIKEIRRFASSGRVVFGICGGYQMLGEKIYDRDLIESGKSFAGGIGLLKATTNITRRKLLSLSEGAWIEGNIPVKGYEIHMGTTASKHKPAIRILKRNSQSIRATDGSIHGKVAGTYLHGIFDGYMFRHSFLKLCNTDKLRHPLEMDYGAIRERQIEELSRRFSRYVNVEKLREIAGL